MSFPAPCPPPPAGAEVFMATVVSVEHAAYECQTTALETREKSCIEVPAAEGLCNDHPTLRVVDGTTRSGWVGPAIGADWCGLPPGHHAISLCTRAGTLDCGVDLPGDGSSLSIVVHGSLPHFSRYHLQPDHPIASLGGADIVVDSSEMALHVGDRFRFSIVPTASGTPPMLTGCSIATPPPQGVTVPGSVPPARAHGCRGCQGGADPGPFALALALIVVVTRRRRA